MPQTNEKFEAMLWNDYEEDPVNELFDELFPELEAYWKVKNLVVTDDSYTYELWFSRLTNGPIREDVLLARITRRSFNYSAKVNNRIYTAFGERPVELSKLETFAKTGVALYRLWLHWIEEQRNRAIAFLSATHPRLGAQSPTEKLDGDLLATISKMCLQ